MIRQSEHKLQCQIVKILRLHNIFCFAVPNGFYTAIKDKGMKYAYMKKRENEGMLSGVADLICLVNKEKTQRTVFLEVKVGNNKQTEKQKIFEKEVKYMHYEYYIIRSLLDLCRIFEFKIC